MKTFLSNIAGDIQVADFPTCWEWVLYATGECCMPICLVTLESTLS